LIPLPLAGVEGLGELERAPGAEAATGVQVDSRRIAPGDLFVAVGDGAAYREDALARGAAAALLPRDAFAALAAIGRAVRSGSDARVVAITGSMGKTSTKDILAALCRPHARTVAAERSYNNEIGVPLTLCRLEPDTEICVAELSMRAPGQIAELAQLVRPEIGAITRIAPVHLEVMGTIEAIAAAKAELVAELPPGGTAIVPASEPLLDPHLSRDDLRLVRVGPGGDVAVVGFEPDGDGSRIAFEVRGERLELEFAFSARHQADNAATALAAYAALGLPLAEAQRGAREVSFSQWRGEELPLPGGGFLINDVWNANPISMRAALEHLAARAGERRRVAVLGDMAELGPNAAALHVEVGEAAAAVRIDALLAIGPLARGYLEGAAGVAVTRHAESLDEGLAALAEFLEPDDAVLVKGARAMGLEAVAEMLVGAAA
jgi:UDP-N-acetylmuramoyl-tripeptide--D-alanyl-D-alanine ligase